MRRIGFVLFLLALLAVVLVLNRLSLDWHYVLPVEPGAAAYIATFDGLFEDWSQYQGQLEAQIADGVLHLEVDRVNSGPFSAANPHFADFDLRVQATAVAGPVNNGFGIVFRLQDHGNTALEDDSYYWFIISSDGYYQVMRVLDGAQKRLSDWIPSAAIQPGIGAANWLRVVARGDQFQFYINNQPVPVCVPNDPAGESTYFEFRSECVDGQLQDTLQDNTISSGQLGVMALTLDEPGVVVEFDNFLVLGPEAPVEDSS